MDWLLAQYLLRRRFQKSDHELAVICVREWGAKKRVTLLRTAMGPV